MRKVSVFGCLVIVLVLGHGGALAQAQPAFDVMVSLKGGPNFNGITEESKATYKGFPADLPYPGFFGVGGGLGLYVEPRLMKLVGLELGLTWESASASGKINGQEVTLNTSDLIIPLHLRVATPGLVQVLFGIGVDFVVPLSAEADYDARRLGDIKAAEREITTYLGVSLGLEIDAVYVKIPIDFRARFALGYDETFDGRVTALNPYTLGTSWEYQGLLLVGVTYPVPIW